MAEQITFFGKGGVGKTTLAANLSAALADAGKKVVLIGCDMKIDTGILIHGRAEIPTLLDYVRAGQTPQISDIVIPGYRGIACFEVGDSLVDDECATRNIGKALAVLHDLDLIGVLQPDYVVYDTPGEIGCAGLAAHLSFAASQRSFIVTSGDLMSFYAANSFIRNIARQPGETSVSIIGNALTGSFEESFVGDFARQVKTKVAGLVPRSLVVRHSELYGKTTIESAPESSQAQLYRRLAHQIIAERANSQGDAINPLSVGDLKSWAHGWGDRLGELEFGIIQDGAGI
jgi:nitrogenase iron protein NifH